MKDQEPRPSPEKLTDSTRRALVLAQEEALRSNHDYIGTEHILLGLIREGSVEKVLAKCGVDDLSKVRASVGFVIGRGSYTPTGEIGLTTRAKKNYRACRR